MHMIRTQSPTPNASDKIFGLPAGTSLSFIDALSFNDVASQNCNVFHFFQSNFVSGPYEIRKDIEKNISLVIMGDGDYRLNSNFCSLLTSLKEAGIKVETLVLNDLELDSETLQEILELLKNELNSMRFNRVPLDQTHIQILNNIKMNLHYVSFAYVLPDSQNVFEDNTGGKNASIGLDLLNLGSEIRYLDLKGIPITPDIQKGIEQLDNLQHLILENLVGSQVLEFLKSLLENLNRYSKLSSLSLAGNNLSSIDFSDLLEESDHDQIFPSTLKKLNFNSTHLSDKHIQDILKLLQASDIKLEGLHLSKCHAYQRTFKALNNFIRAIPDLQYEPPVSSLELLQQDQNNKNILGEATKDNDPNPKIDITIEQVWKNLLEFAREIKAFIEESRAQTAPQGLAKICKLNTANQVLPIVLKDAVGIKAFLNACKNNTVDFTRDPKSLIPKNDFNLALKNPQADLVTNLFSL